MEEVSKSLAAIKTILYGSGEQEPQTDNVTKLALDFYHNDMIFFLIDNLHKVDFEVWWNVLLIASVVIFLWVVEAVFAPMTSLSYFSVWERSLKASLELLCEKCTKLQPACIWEMICVLKMAVGWDYIR